MPSVNFRLLLVTDRTQTGGRSLPSLIQQAVNAGLHDGVIYAVVACPDGRFASAGVDGLVRVSAPPDANAHSCDGPEQTPVGRLRRNPATGMLAAVSSNQIWIETAPRQWRCCTELPGPVSDMAFTSDGRQIWIALANHGLAILDTQAPDELQLTELTREVPHAIAFSPDGAWGVLGFHKHVDLFALPGWRKQASFATTGNSVEAEFSPHRVVGLLGRGGMGEVYRGDDLRLGAPVALKFLPRALAKDPGRRERFLAEVRIARLVSHPNVCRVHDLAEAEGQPFLSMEYIDGEDLASLLKRIGRLPADKALDIARQLSAGLAAAHERGVLHRDLEPANVMLDGRGHAGLHGSRAARRGGRLGGDATSTRSASFSTSSSPAGAPSRRRPPPSWRTSSVTRARHRRRD